MEDVEATLEVNKSDYKSSQDAYAASVSKIDDVRAEKEVVKAEIVRLEALLEDINWKPVILLLRLLITEEWGNEA